ncbi:MAG: thiol peroxidase [Spirochaetales bacterium]|uniref:Thiol peroxidase n=1 Tax=Candidatus Thalassospirochaeta sargassi TaxID=3119039 RepID=A0AAJ1ID12_9SPIO|nr:thiol peroxidase [Spirochaetales bacterium]
MSEITLEGNKINTIGTLPATGADAPSFTLTSTDMSEVKLSDFAGKKLILNIFPSLDTSVCAASVRKFNSELNNLENTEVLCISADLPFAHGRFCESEGLEKVRNASVFRTPDFGKDYGVLITDGPIRGLLSRAVVVVDTAGKVVYTEQVPEITQDPDFDSALKAVKSI